MLGQSSLHFSLAAHLTLIFLFTLSMYTIFLSLRYSTKSKWRTEKNRRHLIRLLRLYSRESLPNFLKTLSSIANAVFIQLITVYLRTISTHIYGSMMKISIAGSNHGGNINVSSHFCLICVGSNFILPPVVIN